MQEVIGSENMVLVDFCDDCDEYLRMRVLWKSWWAMSEFLYHWERAPLQGSASQLSTRGTRRVQSTGLLLLSTNEGTELPLPVYESVYRSQRREVAGWGLGCFLRCRIICLQAKK
jgi:hypothetical protein